MLLIDGSRGEGGGQVLRTALSLSAVTGRAVRVRAIRASRRNPGLAPQHLAAVLALAQLCQAEVQGALLGSTEVAFAPGCRPRPGAYAFDIGKLAGTRSAGSTTLLLQALLMPLALAPGPSQLVLHGGTDVPWSPPFAYLAAVFLPTLAPMGVSSEVVLESRGCYPIGGGRLSARLQGAGQAPLAPLDLTRRGELRRVTGLAFACELPAHVAQRMVDRASRTLRDAGICARLAARREHGPASGAGIFLAAEYEEALAGFSALGEKGKPAAQVADEATAAFLAHHCQGAAVDPHLSDQLLLPMALARGRSCMRTSCVTSHLLTVASVMEQFAVAGVSVEGQEDLPGTVCVESDGVC